MTLANLEIPSLETSLLNFPVKITLQKGVTKHVLTGEEPRSHSHLDTFKRLIFFFKKGSMHKPLLNNAFVFETVSSPFEGEPKINLNKLF